jgi:DNA-binding CsgD family transcriptional regulator
MGYCLDLMESPHVGNGGIGQRFCDGPLPTGLQHDPTEPPDERDAAPTGLRDQVRLGFDTGSGSVTQLYFERRREYFRERDVRLLAMLAPALGRLVRESVPATPARSLTGAERQVLALVARGCSNREVADELFVTVHTVREHLEHDYRKLGMQNRTAAALRLRAEA